MRLADLEKQFKDADLTSKLDEEQAKVLKESTELDKNIAKIEEQTREQVEKKEAADKKMKEMLKEIENK